MASMYPAKISLPQTTTATWAASSTIRTSLEREGVITRIVATAEITPSATIAAATSSPSGPYRVAQNLRIIGGGHTFVELPSTGESGNSSVLLHYLNNEDFGGMPGFPDQQTIAAPNRTFHPVSFVLHMGCRPRVNGVDNPFDLTGLIPARSITDLVAEWVTTANTILDDTVTLDSGLMRYTIYYVIGTHEQIVNEMVRQNAMPPMIDGKQPTAMLPAWIAETWASDGTYTDYNYGRNVPVGRYLKRMSILSQDATGTRALLANDEVTGVKLSVKLQDVFKSNLHTEAATMRKANFVVADDAVELGAGGHVKGTFIKDLRPYGHPDYGLNFLTGPASQVGAPRIGLTVTTQASGDDALFLYEGYVPWFDSLSG